MENECFLQKAIITEDDDFSEDCLLSQHRPALWLSLPGSSFEKITRC